MENETDKALRCARRLLGLLADAFENAVVLFDGEAALVKAAREEAAKAISLPAGEAGDNTETKTEKNNT